MLSSTNLYIRILEDITESIELTPAELVTVAKSIAMEPEFQLNDEISDFIELMASDRPLNHLRKIVYDNRLSYRSFL